MTQPDTGPHSGTRPGPQTWPATTELAATYRPPKTEGCFPIAVDPALEGRRRCQYCGDFAEVFDVDGAWCTPQHQTWDRQSEITYWRKAVAS